jgi:hypothetical protein
MSSTPGHCCLMGCDALAMWRHERTRFDLCDFHALEDLRFEETIPIICPRCRRSPFSMAPEERCGTCWERIKQPVRAKLDRIERELIRSGGARRGVSVGRIVHYTPSFKRKVPGIVTEVLDDGEVSLAIFDPRGGAEVETRHHVEHSNEPAGSLEAVERWSWPER